MKKIVPFYEPRDIYEKIGSNASELSIEEHGFICGLIKEYRPERIVELGVSGGGGTSVLILNCLQKLGIDAKMYSVDLSQTYHFNTDKKCGFQIEEASSYLTNISNHTLMLGKTLPEVIEDIASEGKIDFMILDTIHYLPGELLDFVIALPFLADDAIIVLDDISFWYEGENRWAFATKVLFDLCHAEKYFADTSDGFHKVVAFKMSKQTEQWKECLFAALSMPWNYYDEEQIKNYQRIVNKYFPKEIEESFQNALRINKSAVEKRDNIRNVIQDILEKCRNSEEIYIYGAGQRGKALLFFLQKEGIKINGVIVSDDRNVNQCTDSGTVVKHMSDICLDGLPLILLAAADGEIRDNLNRAAIRYYDVPNYVFPFIKEYAGIMA